MATIEANLEELSLEDFWFSRKEAAGLFLAHLSLQDKLPAEASKKATRLMKPLVSWLAADELRKKHGLRTIMPAGPKKLPLTYVHLPEIPSVFVARNTGYLPMGQNPYPVDCPRFGPQGFKDLVSVAQSLGFTLHGGGLGSETPQSAYLTEPVQGIVRLSPPTSDVLPAPNA
ncbi:MAG: hypothetical protein M3Q36_02080 [bacterium]|nr:hypothetical protein [bacterium]